MILLLVAFRAGAATAVPGLGALVTDRAALPALLLAAAQAAFFILLAAWLLRLPELVPLVRQLRWHRPSPGAHVAGDGVEGK